MDPTTIKIADTETETPPRSQPIKIKPLSFTTNGSTALKKHHHHHRPLPPLTAEVVVYKECLKNHAATLGSHALDGCGEFMPSPDCKPTDPTSLKCVACGCHRNFHRRDNNNESSSSLFTPTHFVEFHHQQPPSRRQCSTSSPSPSPPAPISYAPHMLLALSSAVAADENAAQILTPGTPPTAVKPGNKRGCKRFRTKFSQEQKEKMLALAEKLSWKMPRTDDQTVAEFCNEVGIRRGVLKVWMHNNKNTFGKKEKDNYTLLPTGVDEAAGITNNDNTRIISFDNKNNNSHVQVSNYGSSSSS